MGVCVYVCVLLHLMEIGNRNTNNIKIATENASLCRKICDMRSLLKYAKKHGNMRNVRRSYIRIKLTCLASSCLLI